jgi:transcriptional regulator with XRE-family HTH domain
LNLAPGWTAGILETLYFIESLPIIMYDNTMDKLWDISRQIGARRKRLGLSLNQLARRANTSPATLSRYENGWSRFEVSTLRKLATALDCDLVVKLQPRPRWVERPTVEHVVQQIGRLFWDQVLTTSHLEEHPLWVVERVLDYGNLGDIRILAAFMGREALLNLAGEARFSSDRTRLFWQQALEREGMTCTRKFSREEAASSWRSSNR